MRHRLFVSSVLALAALAIGSPAAVCAQDGTGSTGAALLQLPNGSRAAAFSGAYTAAQNDADVLFYNPSGIASLSAGASVSHGRFVQDIVLTSAAGVLRVGPVSIGAGGAFLDAGEVDVVVPDQTFGGERGLPTGETAAATESAARFALALPLAQGRVRIGAGAGYIASSIAGETRGGVVFDAGSQLELMPHLTVGASLRNLGGDLSGDGEPARLPAEARIGALFATATPAGIGVEVSADYVARLREKTSGFSAGIEAGILPRATGRFGAVARLGYGGTGGESLGQLRIGAGLAIGTLALDYTFQNLEFFGATHRVGLRVRRAR